MSLIIKDMHRDLDTHFLHFSRLKTFGMMMIEVLKPSLDNIIQNTGLGSLEVFSLCLHCIYSKTCVKQLLSKRPQKCFSRPVIAKCRAKYCRMLQRGAFCNIIDLY